MKRLFLVLTFLFCPCLSYSGVSSISDDTPSHGQQITINGSGFGEKTTQGCVKWDTFEDGVVGSNIGTTGFWSTANGFLFSSDPQRSSRSERCIKIEAEDGVVSGNSHSYISQWSTSRKKLFVGWYKVDFIDMASGQLKIMNIERAETHATAPGLAESCLWCYNNECCDGGVTSQLGTGTGNLAYWYQGPTLQLLQQFTFSAYHENQWQYFIIEYEESETGTANGNVNLYKSSTDPLNPTAIQKISSANKISQTENGVVALYAKLRAIIVSGATRANVYYDDVYIDDTWQRVEIGDDASYNNCTHREIQPSTAWSPTSITVTLNQGSMPDGLAWLFVIDENGVPSEGKAITLGESNPIPVNTIPSSLLIQNTIRY